MHDPKPSDDRARVTLMSGVQDARTDLSLEVSEWREFLVSLRTQSGWRKAVRAALPLFAYAVVWVAAYHATLAQGFALSQKPVPPAPLHIDEAVTVAALLLTPWRRWWPYFLLIIPLTAVDFWWLALPLSTANKAIFVATFIVIAGAAIITASLLRRFVASPLGFASVGEVARFAACVAVGSAFAALIGGALRTFFFSWSFWVSWQVAFLGYVLGTVAFTPAIVLWLRDGPHGLQLTSPRRRLELALLGLTVVALGLFVFWMRMPDQIIAHAFAYAAVPALIWAALRFGPQGLTSTLALVSAIAVAAEVTNRGLFVWSTATDNVVALQLFLLFVGVPLFFLAAAVQERKQASVGLQASEARYRDVVESQTELISRYLPDTTLTFVNEANCRSMGLSWEQLRGTKFLDLLPESEHEPVRAMIRSLLAHPGVSTMEHQVRLADGSLRWQQWINRTFLDDTGQVIELQGVGRDITERKQMEEQLHESEARYRATFDSAAIGVAIVDLAGRPLEVNEYVCQMVGYTGGELGAMSLRDFTHPDDVAENDALLRRALDGEIGGYQLEKRYLHKDGHIVWGRLSVSLVRGQDGKPMYFVVHLEDITSRKQLEQERETATAQLEALQAVTDTALTHLGLDDLLHALLERTTSILGVDNAAVLLLDAAGQTLIVTAAWGIEEPATGKVRVPLGQGFAGRIAATREPLVVDDVAAFPVANPLLRTKLHSIAGVPLEVDDRLLGVLHVGTAKLRHFTQHDVRLLQQVAERMALAIDRTRLFEAEQAARAEAERREEELDRVVEQMAEGVAIYDAQGRLVRTNAAQRRLEGLQEGYTERSLSEHMAMFEARDEHDRPLTPEDGPLPRALRGEGLRRAESMDIRTRAPDGRELELSVSAVTLRDKDGLLVGAVAIFRDQTERKRLERERAEQTEQLEVVMKAVPEPLTVYDMDGRVVMANTAYHTLLARLLPQIRPGETVRERVQQLGGFYALDETPLKEDEWAQTRALRGEVLAGRDAVEFMFHLPEGEPLSFSMTAAPLRDPEGHVTGAVAMSRDITAYKRLEREREEARVQAERRAEELDRMFEAMADGVAVYDQDGELVRANTALRRLLGLDTAAAAFAQLPLPERFALFAARDALGQPVAPHEGPLMRALRGEVLAEAATLDGRLRTLDGRDVDLRVSAAPILTSTGQVVGAVLVYRDVTEPKRLERQLAEQAEQLDRIFEGITEGLVVYDAQGQVLRTNAAARRILGLDAGPTEYGQVSTHGRAVLYEARDEEGRLLKPEDWPLIRVLTGVVAGADARDVRLRVLDGREVDVHSSAAPLRDAQGRLVGAVSILHDQTERRRLEREREEARANELSAREVAKHMDAFIAAAAHDIRTPVAVVSMFVELALRRVQRLDEDLAAMLQTTPVSSEDVEQAVTTVATVMDKLGDARSGIDQLQRLAEFLFDVARARSGTLRAKLVPCDLSAIVRSGVTLQQAVAPERRIDLEAPEAAVPVVADADRLGQVLSNYLTNALKYSPVDQPVTVRLKVLGERAVVSVIDHGPGLAEEERSRVWELFHRVPGVEVQPVSDFLDGSLGLGLYICKQLIELHPGGRVGVESVVGDGSAFWFELPLASFS